MRPNEIARRLRARALFTGNQTLSAAADALDLADKGSVDD